MMKRKEASQQQRDKDKDKLAPDTASIASTSSSVSITSTTSSSSITSLSFLNIRKRVTSNTNAAGSPSAQTGNRQRAESTTSATSAASGASLGVKDRIFGKQSSSASIGSTSSSPTKRFLSTSVAVTPGSPATLAKDQPASTGPIPRSTSFSEFRLIDMKQQHQRRCIYALQKLSSKLKVDGVSVGVSINPGSVRKPFKEPKFKDDKRLGLQKLSSLLQKKRRRRSRTETFHLVNLAIIDQNTPYALSLLDELSSTTLRKKFPLHANRAFYSAMGSMMEPVCVAMFEKGFPLSVNTAIVIQGSSNLWKHVLRERGTQKVVEAIKRMSTTTAPALTGGSKKPATSSLKKDDTDTAPPIHLPSYFMAAVALGMENVVRIMAKRADVNQNWHGLTPLHIAASKNLTSVVQLLLDYGADPSIGILVSQYALLRKLKSLLSASICYISEDATVDAVNGPPSGDRSPTFGLKRGSNSPQPSPKFKGTEVSSSASIPSTIGVDSVKSGAINVPMRVSISGVPSAISPSIAASRPHSSAEQQRTRASSLSAATGLTFVGTGNVMKKVTSGGIGSKNGTVCIVSAEGKTKFTGYMFYAQRGSEGDSGKGLYNAENTRRRSSVFHMWNDEFMKGKVILPFELAAACGHCDMARLLFSRMDQKLLAKSSFALIVQRDIDLSLQFIRAGVPATQVDAYGSTALHLACRAGNLELVTAFVESKKFDVNAKGQNDWSPLHESISLRRLEVSKFLVKSGANIDILNNSNETPRQLGLRFGIPKTELDEALSALTPTTASSFHESNPASSPDTTSASTSPSKLPLSANGQGLSHPSSKAKVGDNSRFSAPLDLAGRIVAKCSDNKKTASSSSLLTAQLKEKTATNPIVENSSKTGPR